MFCNLAAALLYQMRIESGKLPEMKNPHLVITKSKRKLELFDDGKLIKTCKIALGFAPAGDKEKEG